LPGPGGADAPGPGAPGAGGAKISNSKPRPADDATLALGDLDRLRQDRTVFVEASWAWSGPEAARGAVVTLVAELDGAVARSPEWTGGAFVQVTLHDAEGRQMGPAATATLSAGARTARIAVPDAPLWPGSYTVRATAKSADRTAADQIRLVVPAAGGLLGRPLFFRRGPFTGPSYALTADLRVRRAERLRLDVPTGASLESMTAALLDRNARPLAVPVLLGERDEGGMRYVTGEITLAPLAFGDYLVEMTVKTAGRPEKVYVAFRVVP
jgi:hypothetical protein